MPDRRRCERRAPIRSAALILVLAWHGPAPSGVRADDGPPLVEFSQDFRGKRFDIKTLKLDGGNAEQMVRPEDKGLRITVPAGLGKPAPIGIATQFQVQGDFEITASYEILKAVEPKDGYGVGVTLTFGAATPGKEEVTAEWSSIPKLGDTLTTTWITVGEDGKRRFQPTRRAARARSGQLRLSRSGAVVEASFAEGPGAAFVPLKRVEFGTADLAVVRLGANTGWSDAPVDLRLNDLRVRAAALPGYSEPTTPVARGASILWVGGGVLAAVAALAGAIWWRASSLRGATGAPDRPSADAWGGAELARLEALASEFAKGHPKAEALVVPPLYQFALRDGKLHGPFIVWEDVDRAGMKDLGASWKELRERLPRRFEGGFRGGRRDGPFLRRSPSGETEARRYRDGEPVA